MKNANEFKIGVIYMYTSPSGKSYIGQTINEKSRKNQHKNKTSKLDTKFGRAIRKYGFENLEYKVLIKFKPTANKEKLKRVLNKLEERYILLYDSVENGYNLTTGGDSALHSEESIEKMKETASHMTDEHKEKLSASAKMRKNKEMDNHIYREIILNNLSKGWGISNPMPEETKQKISNSRKNKKCVKQYDLELNLINTFSSIADAAKSIDSNATLKTKSNRISECVNCKQKTAYNFIWIGEQK